MILSATGRTAAGERQSRPAAAFREAVNLFAGQVAEGPALVSWLLRIDKEELGVWWRFWLIRAD